MRILRILRILRIANVAALLGAALLLSGCISMPKNGGPLTNHIVTTIDDSRCMTASRWWLFAVTNDLNESECQTLIEALRLRQALRLMGSTQASTVGK